MPDIDIVPGPAVAAVLDGRETEVVNWVHDAYLDHHQGHSVNPDSYFLRFADKPDARVIALPAYLGGATDVAGIKWISSFPQNLSLGLPRASAVLVLNDYETGIAVAMLESARISAARTAASAALAAQQLCTAPPRSVGVVGAGPIAATTYRYLDALKLRGNEVVCHDLDATRAGQLVDTLTATFDVPGRTGSLNQALAADLVVLATTAGTPYIDPKVTFRPEQTVLNISLRDLAAEVLLGVNNVLDDVNHCLKANTSPHLTEQLTGNRDFVDGTLGGLLEGTVHLDNGRATVFSPFGLGVLDLAVGHRVHRLALEAGTAVTIADFS
jgi:ornithine cyclodeaminase